MQGQGDLNFGSVGESKAPQPLRASVFGVLFPGQTLQILSHPKDN